MRRTQAMLVLALASGLAAGTATQASATSVVGVGNATQDNTCANHGSANARGGDGGVPGTVSGLVAGVPSSSPLNQCGDLGLPTGAAQTAGGLLGLDVPMNLLSKVDGP
jgi:hypothetical protein